MFTSPTRSHCSKRIETLYLFSFQIIFGNIHITDFEICYADIISYRINEAIVRKNTINVTRWISSRNNGAR